MDPQLQLYYQQSSPAKHYLDRKLQPLFKRIQSRKANSIHQLGPINTTTEPTRIFTKKKFAITQSRHASQDYPNRLGFATRATKRVSVTPTLSLQENTERIKIVSSNSKVKKHLIDFIDFENMQTALFKKRERINLFDQFYQTITQRDRLNKQRVKQRRLKNQNLNQSYAEENYKRSMADSSFRISQRKKFWKQGKADYDELPYRQSLAVRGMAQSRTIDF